MRQKSGCRKLIRYLAVYDNGSWTILLELRSLRGRDAHSNEVTNFSLPAITKEKEFDRKNKSKRFFYGGFTDIVKSVHFSAALLTKKIAYEIP